MILTSFVHICREINFVPIYALYPESFCVKNLATRKVFAFSDSAFHIRPHCREVVKGILLPFPYDFGLLSAAKLSRESHGYLLVLADLTHLCGRIFICTTGTKVHLSFEYRTHQLNIP